MFTVAYATSSNKCKQKSWWYPHVLRLPLADSETLFEDMYIVEVTKCPLVGPASQLQHIHGPLSTHGPLGDIPPLSAKAVIYGVVVNHKGHTEAAVQEA